ncbi:unnamed protein product [Polarella glacialis]|uniref:Uncharacterized protein n=1 Tax=Polarella glacialis TaxID=89957 RepID=A0A813HDG5_POLGL|nr:unnamed protein product [Polarella glacialis]
MAACAATRGLMAFRVAAAMLAFLGFAVGSPGGSALQNTTGACRGDSDQKIWRSGGEYNFGGAATGCGRRCYLSGSCSAVCLAEQEGYSANCSSCMGSLVSCTASQCLKACWDVESCVTCIQTNCTPAFTNCSGLEVLSSAQAPSSSCSPAFGNCSGLQILASALAQDRPNSVRAALCAPRSTEDGGACKGQADQKIWKSGGDRDFAGVSAACGRRCLGRKSCSSDCVVKEKGYSQSCGRCMGTLISCSVSKCLVACWPDGADTCKQCVQNTCNPAFASCSGLGNPATASKNASALPPPGSKASGLQGGALRCIGCR